MDMKESERTMSEKEIKDIETAENIEELADSVPSETQGSDSAPNSAEKPKKPYADALEWVSSLVYAVLIMLGLNLFVFRSITVDGKSMNNTLQDQDRVIAFNLFYTPQRGDIVVLQADKLSPDRGHTYGEPIIKRVIAVGGDTVKFDFDKGEVYLKKAGESEFQLLHEDYILEKTLRSESCISGREYEVAEGYIFVMGDNRNNSTDSRDYRVGMVDTDYIMGKAVFRFMPFDSIGLL